MARVNLFAKALSSDELKIRRKAQKEVANFICRHWKNPENQLSYLNMLKICKGLHYSLWMQDKLLLKEEVVKRICDILPQITNDVIAYNFVNAIFETLAREWDGLDTWRVDKFMLLTRDFFCTGLRTYSGVHCDKWSMFLDCIFNKVLNVDMLHAVGLKMHMCTILSEELLKKGVKCSCVESTFSRLITLLDQLPKHNTYMHTILRLLHTLILSFKRHAKAHLEPIITTLSQMIAKRNAHRGSLKRILLMLQAISTKKQALISVQSSPIPEKPDLKNDMAENKIETTDSNKSKKRKKTDRVKKLTDTINHICKPKRRKIHVQNSFPYEDVLKNVTSTSEVTPLPASTPDQSNDGFEQTENACATDQETADSLRRRVSFGKVFRKRFSASRRLSLTPVVKSTPVKGILREQVSSSKSTSFIGSGTSKDG